MKTGGWKHLLEDSYAFGKLAQTLAGRSRAAASGPSFGFDAVDDHVLHIAAGIIEL